MPEFVCTDVCHGGGVTAFHLSVCVCVRVRVGMCEEQFQMVISPLRATQTKKGNTSQRGSRAAQTEMEEQHAGNTKLIVFSLSLPVSYFMF